MSALDAAYAALKADGRVSVSKMIIAPLLNEVIIVGEGGRRTITASVGRDLKSAHVVFRDNYATRKVASIAPEAIADIAAAWVLEGRLP